MRHLRSLTALHSMAVPAIVLSCLARNNDPGLPAFFLRGYLGVGLFCVLSGFVLAHVYRVGMALALGTPRCHAIELPRRTLMARVPGQSQLLAAGA